MAPTSERPKGRLTALPVSLPTSLCLCLRVCGAQAPARTAAVAAQVVSDDRLGLMPREALLAFAQQMRLVVTSTRDVEAAGKGAAPQGGAAVRSATRAAEPTVKRDKLL